MEDQVYIQTKEITKPHQFLSLLFYFFGKDYTLINFEETITGKKFEFQRTQSLCENSRASDLKMNYTMNLNDIRFDFNCTNILRTRPANKNYHTTLKITITTQLDNSISAYNDYNFYQCDTISYNTDFNNLNEKISQTCSKTSSNSTGVKISGMRKMSFLHDEEFKKVNRTHEAIVKRIKFCEKYHKLLFDKIVEYFKFANIAPSFKINLENYYDFKKYIKHIEDFKSGRIKNYTEDLRSLFNILKYELKPKMSIELGPFKFYKSIHSNTDVRISMKKNNQLTFNLNETSYYSLLSNYFINYNPFFDLFLPIYQSIGGDQQLRALILKERLLKE